MQSPIEKDCPKVKINSYNDPQLVPKLLLQVYVRKLHNNIVSDTKDGELKEEIDEYDNVLISDCTLRSLFPNQFKNVIKIQGRVWLQILHICQKYAFVITFIS